MVDHLIDAIQPCDRALGQLLQIKGGHVAMEKKRLVAVFAPNALHGQMRVAHNSVSRLHSGIASAVAA